MKRDIILGICRELTKEEQICLEIAINKSIIKKPTLKGRK